MEISLESIGGAVVAVVAVLVISYFLIAMAIFIMGMLAGLLARPVLWLISKTMSLFGIQWEFRPYRRVLVLDEDGVHESREIWDGFPDDWSSFDDEWLLGTVVAALLWPYFVFTFVSWPIRRLVTS